MEHLRELAITLATDASIDFLAVDQQNKAGNATDTEPCGELFVLIDVDFANRIAGRRESVNNRVHLLAGTTPRSGEVQQDRFARTERSLILSPCLPVEDTDRIEGMSVLLLKL